LVEKVVKEIWKRGLVGGERVDEISVEEAKSLQPLG
jgi:hypothetical protein